MSESPEVVRARREWLPEGRPTWWPDELISLLRQRFGENFYAEEDATPVDSDDPTVATIFNIYADIWESESDKDEDYAPIAHVRIARDVWAPPQMRGCWRYWRPIQEIAEELGEVPEP